jgi:hypothetical protein
MERFGPQYCETPDIITGIFPVEPWNAISSGVIVLFGLASLFVVARRTPRAYELYLLCALLIINGTGSILWHGLRTRWALNLDWMPAVVFVIIVCFLWARRVAPLWQAAIAGGVLIAVPLAVRYLDFGSPWPTRMGVTMAAIIGVALWLITRSYWVSRSAALTGGLALLSASAALTFRSIDGATCEMFPGQGLHFLWHIFLSAAAFLCMVTLTTLYGAKRPEEPATVAAE